MVVERLELFEKYIERPRIGRDMMHADHQRMILRAQLVQRHPHQQIFGNVERLARRFAQPREQFGLAPFRCDGAQVHVFNFHRPGRHHFLHRLAVLRDEARSEHFMARHDGVCGLFERAELQRALHPNRNWHVVHWAVWLQLIEEPQSLLCERKWRSFRICPPRDGRRARLLAGSP